VSTPDPHDSGLAARNVALLFLVSLIAAVGFAIAYSRALDTQLLGLALGFALIALGAGMALWSKRLMPQGPFVEKRPDLTPSPEERRETSEAFWGGGRGIGRRKILGPLFAAAAGVLGIAVLFPFRSLGPRPGNAFFTTGWRRGSRLVTEEGHPVRVDELSVDSVLTVFPDGVRPSAQDQVIIVRVDAAALRPRPGRETWSPGGHLAYSKICTHAGCPVGLYQPADHVLLCPCHQASFDVLDAARPVFGPATRPLPQLPLDVDHEGYLVARSDFPEPTGPGFWEMGPIDEDGRS
jgi:ubiquinol-cytochrome c reductase iron-sulfur subunit